jgi:iron complex transport system substrate-binding protein
MRLCGLKNVFADVSVLVPRINQEAVLEADPQLIIAGGMGKVRPDWGKQWQRWTNLSAIRLNALFDIHPDIIQRHSPRILLGAAELCEKAETIRKKL